MKFYISSNLNISHNFLVYMYIHTFNFISHYTAYVHTYYRNIMEMFGLTLTGYGNYFTEILNKDYQEPILLPNIKEILEERVSRNPTRSFNEVYNKLDSILGTTDGFPYRSYELMYLQRKKGLWKPVGPTDMYRIPATRAQEVGFWTKDSLLSDADWIKSTKKYGRRYSEMSKTFRKLKLANPLVAL